MLYIIVNVSSTVAGNALTFARITSAGSLYEAALYRRGSTRDSRQCSHQTCTCIADRLLGTHIAPLPRGEQRHGGALQGHRTLICVGAPRGPISEAELIRAP